MRTIGSKKVRNALYEYFEGKCQRCGEALTNFEVDHVIPYVRTGDSNIENLQILCRHCNRVKGAKLMVKLRSHQAELVKLADEIALGRKPDLKSILAIVVPGGGKSALPLILFSKLAGRYIDKICWVVPRENLAKQAEDNFLDQDWRAFLHHDHRIRIATNDKDPCRGFGGYVTTYQALTADDGNLNLKAFQQYGRMLLVLDEFHHVGDSTAVKSRVSSLIDNSRLSLLMSGDPDRGDGEKVALLEYQRIAGIGWSPILENSNSQHVIRYNRRQALNEQAIIPLHFEHMDGATTYRNSAGVQQDVESIAELSEPGAALFSALSTEYAMELLARAVSHWQHYRVTHPYSKLLVIAPRVSLARDYLKHLHGLGLERAGIAVSEDGGEAGGVIKRFKATSGVSAFDALVTVGMAYEGMDVPSITHIAALTHVRSKPWIHQMLARAVRVDRMAGAYKDQHAFVFSPDDQPFQRCIAEIIGDQEAVVRDKVDGTGGGTGNAHSNDIIPIMSELTRSRAQDFTDGTMVGYEEAKRIQVAMAQGGINGVSTVQFHHALQAYQHAETLAQDHPAPSRTVISPSEEEAKLRRAIEDYCRRWDKATNQDWGTLNKRVRRHFNKPRDEMTIAELQAVWAWLHESCPIEG